jgi:hypothetical protein
VGVMLWSGYTVLEKGSSRDPRVSFWSREWWSFELQAVFSSWLGIIYGGSMVIMINTLTVLTMIPFGA